MYAAIFGLIAAKSAVIGICNEALMQPIEVVHWLMIGLRHLDPVLIRVGIHDAAAVGVDI